MTRARLLILLTTLSLTAAWAFQAATRPRVPPPLASFLPQGALLTIESPDFAALLQTWNASPEQRAWLTSDNHSVFANSRLFSRLDDARTEFEGVAAGHKDDGPSFDGDFLTQIAGRQSIFAWYDIGKLEFVYLTRLSPRQSAHIALLQQRSAFLRRQVGTATFYVRHAAANGAQERTVAFALIQSPNAQADTLILATREDLIATTLQLIANPRNPSLSQELWFTEASTSLAPEPAPPALHMVLNLDRLVATPYFHSYWIQRNITEMKQYRSGVADLYREAGQFREERALLLKSPASDPNPSPPDLTTLATLAPPSGVFRAMATHDPADAVTAIEEKLLGHATPAELNATQAPDPSLDVAASGTSNALETYIDTPPPVSATTSNSALTQLLAAANMDALLTWSSASPLAASTPAASTPPANPWVDLHSAVLLHSTRPMAPQTLEDALQQSLRGTLTAATLGIEFRQTTATTGQAIYALNGPKDLFFALLNQGHLCLLTDDRPLLLSLLEQAAQPPPSPTTNPPSLIAGFHHASQRAPFAQLSAAIDPAPGPQAPAADQPSAPPFLSGNLRSLSDSFAAFTSQRLVEHREAGLLRQTVTYQLQRP